MQTKHPHSDVVPAHLPSPSTARAPAPDPLRRPVPRQFLERVSRPLLVRLVSQHASVLEIEHGFSLAALAASAQTDRVQVEALWHILSAASPQLAALREELIVVADVATRAGHEALLLNDVARALDHDLGAEDSAATAYLDHQSLFDSVRPQAAGQAQTKSFASFQAVSPLPLPDDPKCRLAFARRMRADLVRRGRSDFFKVHEWRSGTERHMEIVYGRLAAARDLIGKTKEPVAEGTHDVTAQVTDRSSERAHVVFHDGSCLLELAGPDWMKELIRREFGRAYFGSATHFKGSESLLLLPLLDHLAALSADGIPGLQRVELQMLCVDLDKEGGWVAVGARGSCTTGAPGSYFARALTDGPPAEAVFHLYLVGRKRPLTVKVSPPRLIFERRDPRVVRIVRDWLVARGFLKVADGAVPFVEEEPTAAAEPTGS